MNGQEYQMAGINQQELIKLQIKQRIRDQKEMERIRKEKEDREHHLEFLKGCKTILELPPKEYKPKYDLSNLYVFDFETTVYEGQTKTEVWGAGRVGLFEETEIESVTIDNTLSAFMERCLAVDANTKNASLNLKFDGAFILNWLMHNGFKRYERNGEFCLYDGYMPRDGYYTYTISADGQWYSIIVSKNGHYHMFFDLYKLIPFSVEKIGKELKTKFQKAPEIDYKSHKSEGEEITEEEAYYLACDCLVIKEAYEIMVKRGAKRTTISSCAMEEYKKWCMFDEREFRKYFVDLTLRECPLDETITSHEYLKRAYHGGFCWCNDKIANKTVKNGFTLDVNSLYPYVLRQYRMPVGAGHWFNGEIPEEAKKENNVYIVRIKARFTLKPGQLPCCQIRNNPAYKCNEWLTTTDINGSRFIKVNGKVQLNKPEITVTNYDLELMKEAYNMDYEVIDGVWFNTMPDLFNTYIDKFYEMKKDAPDAVSRFCAKLYINALGGRFGADRKSSVKVLTSKNGLTKEALVETEKEPGYIPVAIFMTSIARTITIRAARSFGLDHICYCDTDSMHVRDFDINSVKDIVIDSKILGAWKHECSWDQAKFYHQKCYIERHVTGEYDVKCAGLSHGPASKLAKDLENGVIKLSDIKPGYKVRDNLKAVNIDGGVILTENDFEF